MRALTALILSTSLLASSVAVAADNAGPLAPGKPAGVKQADLGSTTTLVLLGFAVVAAIAIGVASGSNGSPVQPTAPTGTTTG
ncbi:MAG TPA: hypothetical protein VFA87_02235 [Rhizomicrobium sp.]|nr:hypothetical protein [Rhizomicrobium sp.]